MKTVGSILIELQNYYNKADEVRYKSLCINEAKEQLCSLVDGLKKEYKNREQGVCSIGCYEQAIEDVKAMIRKGYGK